MSLHVQDRPFPGYEPAEPDPGLAEHGLAVARRILAEPTSEPAPCPPECTICHSAWQFFGHAIGPCVVCDQPCRSTDPGGRMRHITCKGEA